MIMSSVILLLMVLAVAALVSLQSIFSKFDHINTQANAVVDLSNHMNLSISRVEILLHELYSGKTHRLDELIVVVQRMQDLNEQLGVHYILHQKNIGPVFGQLEPLLDQFTVQISTLATTEDMQLLGRHNIEALSAATGLRNHILQISQFAHQHSQSETTDLTSQFRVFVIAIAVGFLLVINLSILVLLHSANMILKPMDKLLKASRELAKEHFDYRVTLGRHDEFDELGEAYNHLASQLELNEQHRMDTLHQVARTLNHELNNAVSVIDLQLHLLRRQTNDKDAFETSLKQIHENLERMTKVVQGLKNARRIVLTDYADGVKMLDLERSSSYSDDSVESNKQDQSCDCREDCNSKPAPDPDTESNPKPASDRPRDLEKSKHDPVRDRMLFARLRWFVRLRWLAAVTVISGAIIDMQWTHWYAQSVGILGVGIVILLYNTLFRLRDKHEKFMPDMGKILAWSQIVLDLGALSFLTIWTGGVNSPLLGFFVFHMVFASLLLPRHTAYAGAAMSVVMVLSGLALSGQWPLDEAHATPWQLVIVGWAMTLLLTVYLANSITQSLNHNRHRLMTQNSRIRAMAHRLQTQQMTMVQHEKMVAMGQMAAGVAHEIANPLANIDSMLQLAQRNPDRLNPQKLEQMRTQVNRIREILGQLTNFAHPTDMHWETMPVIDLVEMGLSMVRFDRRHRAVTIERNYSQTPCLLHLQPHAMQQVLINLMLNAIDAMNDIAEPRLIISTQCFDKECHISITDNGSGILPQNIPHLFEPFFTTKPVGKGTGLGLAISYSLVVKQGGRIDVQSTHGKGTTMTISIPKADEQQTTDHSSSKQGA
ncbi:HAMP domain-containing protein [bacterium AH-315-I18]|nr:HAMP domain-containing protein [bacterium AH-315-I18]